VVKDVLADAADTDAESDVSVNFSATAAEEVVEALSAKCGLPREGILPALSGLGLACWSAHRAAEHDDVDDEDAAEGDEGDHVAGG
jgi:hypothetical protein